MPTQAEVIDHLGSQLPEKSSAHFQQVPRSPEGFSGIEGAREMVVFVGEEGPEKILDHPVLGPILKAHADAGALFAERRGPVDRSFDTTLKHDVISIPVSGFGSVQVIHLISGASPDGEPEGDGEFHVPRKVRSSTAAIKKVVGDIVHQGGDGIAIFLDGQAVRHDNAAHVLKALGRGTGNITYETDFYRTEPGEKSKDGFLSEAEKAELALAISQGWQPSSAELSAEGQFAELQGQIERKKFVLKSPEQAVRSTRNAIKDVYLVSDVEGDTNADALIAKFEEGDMLSRVQSLCKFLSEAPHNLLDCEVFVRVLNKLNECIAAMGNTTEIEIFGPNIEGLTVTGSLNSMGRKLEVLEALHAGSGKELGPFVVVMKYRHPEANDQPVHVLAGKSIMFDTGGYCNKLDHAKEMQGDMMGGASIAAEFARFGEEKPVINADFIFGIASNKISGDARVQEDIHRHGSGRMVEEANTDAEGREALGDALWLGLRRLRERGEKIASVTSLATLTGAAILAGGHRTLGISPSKRIRRLIEDMSQANGDRIQPEALVIEDLKASSHAATGQADMKNLGNERKRMAQNAAAYIKEAAGVDEIPFLHLDIAPAMTSDKYGTPKDVQGYFACEGYLDTLHEYLMHLAQEQQPEVE